MDSDKPISCQLIVSETRFKNRVPYFETNLFLNSCAVLSDNKCIFSGGFCMCNLNIKQYVKPHSYQYCFLIFDKSFVQFLAETNQEFKKCSYFCPPKYNMAVHSKAHFAQYPTETSITHILWFKALRILYLIQHICGLTLFRTLMV